MIDSSNLPRIATITAVVAFGVYRRVRRNIGRQVLTARRQYVLIGLFSVLCVVLAFLQFRQSLQPLTVAYIASGLIVGAAIGWFALRHTEFAATAEGYFYTPHLYIGIAVTALFVGRLLYRMVPYLGTTQNATAGAAPTSGNNSLTLGILFLTGSYYVVYCTGLLQWLGKAQRAASVKLSQGAPDGASSTSV